MQKTIEVVYEKGVFKPLEKINLRERERMRIEVRDFKSGDEIPYRWRHINRCT
ncbi:MAG: antitoxin family protein [Halobacteriota archaeon]